MRALRIPAAPHLPLEVLKIDRLNTVALALGGTPRAISAASDATIRGYRSADVDVLAGVTVNLRATRLFGGVRPGQEFVGGDIIVVGAKPGDGQDYDCPAAVEQRLRAPVRVGAPASLVDVDRGRRLEWVTADDGAGTRTLVLLTARYRPGARSERTGRRIAPNHFAAVLRFGYELPVPPPASGTARGELHGDGLSVVRETVPRFTRAGLEQFTELAVERVRGLAAGGDECIARYFA